MTALHNAPLIRPGRDDDAAAFIALIGACWSQYPGVKLDVDGEMPELRALAGYYGGKGGALWTAEADGQMVGMIATRPLPDGAWEICRVYVLPGLHGGGLGHRLLDVAEAHARGAGAERLVLWSDTRFDRAHRFYEKRSYVRFGPIRVLDDISYSLEFAYAKPVHGVEVLDAAAAASAVPRLAFVATGCTEADAAPDHWQGVAKDVAAGSRALLAGWRDGALAGLAVLGFPAVPHRAEVEALLVHADFRRRGQGGALLERLEQEAARTGRLLLTVQARADDAAGDALWRRAGWQQAGRVPGFTLRADGGTEDMALLWKRLG